MAHRWVKICGITRTGDALAAEALGAAAVGFVFHPESRRYIEPAAARAVTDALGPFIARVGVFVDHDAAAIRGIVREAGLTAVQLHGSEPPEIVGELGGIPVIRAFRVGEGSPPRDLAAWQAAAYLLDTYVPGEPGGTGVSFDWDIARAATSSGRIILAGGLDPDNVADAVRTADPWGIDVSGGVEAAPGIKDHETMAAFIEAVRGADTTC